MTTHTADQHSLSGAFGNIAMLPPPTNGLDRGSDEHRSAVCTPPLTYANGKVAEALSAEAHVLSVPPSAPGRADQANSDLELTIDADGSSSSSGGCVL